MVQLCKVAMLSILYVDFGVGLIDDIDLVRVIEQDDTFIGEGFVCVLGGPVHNTCVGVKLE